jgi:hypothetical protein
MSSFAGKLRSPVRERGRILQATAGLNFTARKEAVNTFAR